MKYSPFVTHFNHRNVKNQMKKCEKNSVMHNFKMAQVSEQKAKITGCFCYSNELSKFEAILRSVLVYHTQVYQQIGM